MNKLDRHILLKTVSCCSLVFMLVFKLAVQDAACNVQGTAC